MRRISKIVPLLIVALIIMLFTGVAGAQEDIFGLPIRDTSDNDTFSLHFKNASRSGFSLSSNTIYVPDNYAKIQWAADNASAGDTIIVRDGTYTENIAVNTQHLTILSENGAENAIVQAANPRNDVFYVSADYVNIIGFTVKGANAGRVGPSRGYVGIYLGSNADYCNISNIIASNNWCGIYLWSSNNNSITNNNCSYNKVGIVLSDSNNNSITNNNCSNNHDTGISLPKSNENTLAGNTLTNNDYGIYLYNADDNDITCNLVAYNNESGFYLYEHLYNIGDVSTGNWIENNNILSNGKYNVTSDGYEWNFKNDQTCAVDAKHNYWGATENSQIDAGIYDDEEGKGKVEFYPFATELVFCPTSPTVIRHTPTGTSVLMKTTITVTFSKAMDKTSAEAAFSISPSVTGSFSWVGNKMIFTPSSGLALDTTYSVSIGTGAEDLAGNNIESPYNWLFTTMSEAPQIYVDDDFVDDPANHKWNTIQEGINDANDGDFVYVFSGLYCERVIVNKSVTLRGEDRDSTIIDGNIFYFAWNKDVVSVTADGCEISEFTVQNSEVGFPSFVSGAGIHLGSDNNIVTDITTSHNYFGIELALSSGNTLMNNIVSHNEYDGIFLWDSSHNILTNNIVSHNSGDGIFLCADSSANTLMNNIVSYNDRGINLWGYHPAGTRASANANTLSYNTLTNNDHGISLANAADNKITCNQVAHNNENGCYLRASTGNRIEHNNIMSNGDYNAASGGYEWNFVNNLTDTVEAKHNYWGATENSMIDASIYDDEEEEGKVEFYPFATEPVLCAATPDMAAIMFDTGKPANPYLSISGTYKGTITPKVTIEVSSLYTYPCAGTGGHTKYASIYNNSWSVETQPWDGYTGDWHNLYFPEPFMLYANVEYKYTIRTGSYPQIHHTKALQTATGWINCTSFTDANGKVYDDWIPAIKIVAQDQTKLTLLGWWLPTWSEDAAELNVRYTQGRNTLSEESESEIKRDIYGEPVWARKVITREGEDMYGREQNISISLIYKWYCRLKPDSVEAHGTFTYPAGTKFGQSEFARSFDETVNYEYDGNGRLAGGSGNEHFYGHISTLTGIITYSGSATPTFKVKNGQLLCTEHTETTNYYYNDKYYAETVTVITPKYEYLGGKWVTVRETVKTHTTYADGGKRESVIVILWQRDLNGRLASKSGSGSVTGTEFLNGKTVSYTGSGTIDYDRYKTVYSEERSAEAGLLKRLPFEVMYIDDYYLRSMSLDAHLVEVEFIP